MKATTKATLMICAMMIFNLIFITQPTQEAFALTSATISTDSAEYFVGDEMIITITSNQDSLLTAGKDRVTFKPAGTEITAVLAGTTQHIYLTTVRKFPSDICYAYAPLIPGKYEIGLYQVATMDELGGRISGRGPDTLCAKCTIKVKPLTAIDWFNPSPDMTSGTVKAFKRTELIPGQEFGNNIPEVDEDAWPDYIFRGWKE